MLSLFMSPLGFASMPHTTPHEDEEHNPCTTGADADTHKPPIWTALGNTDCEGAKVQSGADVTIGKAGNMTAGLEPITASYESQAMCARPAPQPPRTKIHFPSPPSTHLPQPHEPVYPSQHVRTQFGAGARSTCTGTWAPSTRTRAPSTSTHLRASCTTQAAASRRRTTHPRRATGAPKSPTQVVV